MIQNEALNDYPEDRALLARKAQKAAKEVAAKQAPNPDQVSNLPNGCCNRLKLLKLVKRHILLMTKTVQMCSFGSL